MTTNAAARSFSIPFLFFIHYYSCTSKYFSGCHQNKGFDTQWINPGTVNSCILDAAQKDFQCVFRRNKLFLKLWMQNYQVSHKAFNIYANHQNPNTISSVSRYQCCQQKTKYARFIRSSVSKQQLAVVTFSSVKEVSVRNSSRCVTSRCLYSSVKWRVVAVTAGTAVSLGARYVLPLLSAQFAHSHWRRSQWKLFKTIWRDNKLTYSFQERHGAFTVERGGKRPTVSAQWNHFCAEMVFFWGEVIRWILLNFLRVEGPTLENQGRSLWRQLAPC